MLNAFAKMEHETKKSSQGSLAKTVFWSSLISGFLLLCCLFLGRVLLYNTDEMVFCNLHKGSTVDVKNGKVLFKGAEFDIMNASATDAEDGTYKIQTVSSSEVVLENDITVSNKTLKDAYSSIIASFKACIRHYHHCS